MTAHKGQGQQEVLGIDGCPGGWLIVGRDPFQYSLEVVSGPENLQERIYNSALTFIDIPIGFHATESPRNCDVILRGKLGPYYANSVFNVPVREAVYAKSYEEACDINQKITGKKFSRQFWNIIPRVREIDSLLQNCGNMRYKVKECHPEWLFKLMNGNEDISAKKKTNDGSGHRKKLLFSRGAPVDDLQAKLIEHYYRKDAKVNDLLDALALNYSAWQTMFGDKELKSFPSVPEFDERGRHMAIFYTDL